MSISDIENLLRFHEYFDDKTISMKDLEEKRSCKYPPPSWILSRGQQVSSSFQVSSFKKYYRRCTNGSSSKTAEENRNIIKLNVSLNRQNIK